MTQPLKYTCARCDGEFTSDWSDEEAKAEHEDNFGYQPGAEACVVCDDCYRLVMGL